jgi:hypothetical protein
LGRLSARVGAEEAFAAGRTLLQAGGAVAHEFRGILESVESMTQTESTESYETYESPVI